MLNIYTLLTHAMNGTVTMKTIADSFTSRELAEEAKKAVEEANKDSDFSCWCEIQETVVFENRSEVPILNKE